jgi:hypothetical protein
MLTLYIVQPDRIRALILVAPLAYKPSTPDNLAQ